MLFPWLSNGNAILYASEFPEWSSQDKLIQEMDSGSFLQKFPDALIPGKNGRSWFFVIFGEIKFNVEHAVSVWWAGM